MNRNNRKSDRPESGRLCRKVLVVEDEPILRLAIQDALMAEGCTVESADNGNEGLELFQRNRHDIVLTDMVMPGIDGLELIEKIKQQEPSTTVFAFTAYGNVDTAVRAMKLGARDFIPKPFAIRDLVEKIRRAVKKMEAEPPAAKPGRPEAAKSEMGSLIGRSRQMRRVYEMVETVAQSDANILIRGESGTGKELVAGAIHFNSPRREKPFIKVSCASLSETLLESELFGHEKGAFTGAQGRKIGRFEQAHEGTIFLDEIGDVSETVQIKLLRVLQEREFERVGGTETIHVDVRIVSATLHDIEALVDNGRFREDLFYRINTVTINLPPLADREGDIPILADHFRKIHSRRIGKRVIGFSERVMAALQRYNWPGNVRELKNVVERAVLLTGDEIIRVDVLPESLRRIAEELKAGDEGATVKDEEPLVPLEEALKTTEERHIRRALKQTEFNRTRAAELLGISRKTLWEKMRAYNIEP